MRGSWDRKRAVAIAIGAVVGAVLRWAVSTSVDGGRFPWPVLVVNVAGSLLLGVLLAEEWSHPRARLLLHDAGGIGFCGSLTTFSTFSVEVVAPLTLTVLGVGGLGAFTTFSSFARDAVALAELGRIMAAAFYVGTTVVLGLAAASAGVAVAHT